jgi:hypothetical protein
MMYITYEAFQYAWWSSVRIREFSKGGPNRGQIGSLPEAGRRAMAGAVPLNAVQ